MKRTTSKIQEIFNSFGKTLEERDREDMKLYGWKGGQIHSYRAPITEDSVSETDSDETQE